MGCLMRLAEIIFFVYFFTHIPITILIDAQTVALREWFPKEALDLTAWYVKEHKDTYFANPPTWYKTFVYIEQFIQLPFFFIAAYAFLAGGKSWIRIPAIVYSSHVATTVLPMLVTFAIDDFSESKPPGPSTQEERRFLIAVYAPYFVIPMWILLTMCLNPNYGLERPVKKQQQSVTKSPKKKHFKGQ